MRFLCLHGMGTGAEVFEAQLGPLMHALSQDGHEFEFYEGEYETEPAPGIKEVFPADSYKTWYAPDLGADSHKKALDLVRDIMTHDGPFDGCIGFSQGAALLASVIISHQIQNPFAPPLFHLAVFICGSSALSVENGGVWKRLDPSLLKQRRQRIKIPTVHIYGSADTEYYEESLRLRDSCEDGPGMGKRGEYDTGRGHEVPRGRDKVEGMVRVIRRGVERALSAH